MPSVGQGLGLSGGGTLKLGPGRLDIARADGRDERHQGASPLRGASRGGGRSGCRFVRGFFAVTRGNRSCSSCLQNHTSRRNPYQQSRCIGGYRPSSWPAQSRMDPSSHVPFVDRLAQRSARRSRFPSYNSSSYTRPPRNQFLLQSSNGWAACSGSGFCRTRRAIERDQCFGGWREPWGTDGDAKKAVPAVPTVVHGGFRSGRLMFRGLLSENCLDGTLRLIRGRTPWTVDWSRSRDAATKHTNEGIGLDLEDPAQRLFKGAKISWNGKKSVSTTTRRPLNNRMTGLGEKETEKKTGIVNPRGKGKIHRSTCSQPAQFRGHHAVSGGLSMSPLDTIGHRQGSRCCRPPFFSTCAVCSQPLRRLQQHVSQGTAPGRRSSNVCRDDL